MLLALRAPETISICGAVFSFRPHKIKRGVGMLTAQTIGFRCCTLFLVVGRARVGVMQEGGKVPSISLSREANGRFEEIVLHACG